MPDRATATAHPNIALVKYWGKRPGPGNVPATPSLSVTLDALTTTTTAHVATVDRIVLDGAPVADPKIEAFLRALRADFDIPPVAVTSSSDFPAGCGLASSASGFAALITAIDGALRLGLGRDERSEWARRGSGSAARSLVGGIGTLSESGGRWLARELLAADAWPLRIVIGVTSRKRKAVGSTEGMERSRATSPFYAAWVNSTATDFADAERAVIERDFDALGRIAEGSCLKMHALMLSSDPALLYWNGATVECLHRIRALRAAGTDVFFTVDAGPQVKAVCTPPAERAVRDALATVPGVEEVLVSGLGAGASCTVSPEG